jgi:antitoxin (DNA-binding transcriptional repressor) of toxin-antitoxin stability system
MVVAMKRKITGRDRKKIVIAKRGGPVARLDPIARKTQVIFGRLKGTGRAVDDLLSTGESWEADA